MFEQSRINLSLLVQFITGHNYLRYHKSKSGQFDQEPTCRLCDDATEDSWHLLTVCPALCRKRLDTFCVPEITHLPHPKKTLYFIRNTFIVQLMEPDEDVDALPPPTSARSALEALAGGIRDGHNTDL